MDEYLKHGIVERLRLIASGAMGPISGVQQMDVYYAAEVIEFMFGQLQQHSPKMSGLSSYRFKNGWPMTHCVGPCAEDAVKAAIQEVRLAAIKTI